MVFGSQLFLNISRFSKPEQKQLSLKMVFACCSQTLAVCLSGRFPVVLCRRKVRGKVNAYDFEDWERGSAGKQSDSCVGYLWP